MLYLARSLINHIVHIFKQRSYIVQSLQINLFKDEITSLYFNQKAISNFRSHYQAIVMVLIPSETLFSLIK